VALSIQELLQTILHCYTPFLKHQSENLKNAAITSSTHLHLMYDASPFFTLPNSMFSPTYGLWCRRRVWNGYVLMLRATSTFPTARQCVFVHVIGEIMRSMHHSQIGIATLAATYHTRSSNTSSTSSSKWRLTSHF